MMNLKKMMNGPFFGVEFVLMGFSGLKNLFLAKLP
jgi:hypothetical protein